MPQILPIRTTLTPLTDQEKKAEYLRLGIKARIAEIRKGPSTIFRRIYIDYFKGSGLIPSDADSDPKSSWVPPAAPSSAHLAFLDHADESAFTAPLAYKEQNPYWCYLVKHGWIKVPGFTGAKIPMIDINAAVWEKACHKAIASQSAENVFLNPRGLAILGISLGWYVQLASLDDLKDDLHRPYRRPKILKTITENNYPIGPGFETFLKRFKSWLSDASPEDLKQFIEHLNTKGPSSALIPWVLKYSSLAKTQSGMLALIPLMCASHDYDQPELIFRVRNLLSNKYLGQKSKDLLTEWALGQALHFQYDHQYADLVREIFGHYSNKPPHLSSMQYARVRLALNEKLSYVDFDEHADDKQELRTLAMIPAVSHDAEIRQTLIDLNHDAIFCEMLYHSTGPDWLDLATRLDASHFEDVFESEFIKALKHASSYHLQGLRRLDLAPLLQSKRKEVRTITIRLATLIQDNSKPAKTPPHYSTV